MSRLLLATLFVLGGLFAVSAGARAAESYDNCTGFIDTLPATIDTQGVWCLDRNLSTAITSGIAITIATNNVTIDCNDFKIGGLAAGAGTQALGIYAENRSNATLRRCNVRGFFRGVFLAGSGSGHVVEDNRFDSNTLLGLVVSGDGSVVRRNLVVDTGGSTAFGGGAGGIQTYGAVDVLDNTVSGVLPGPDGGSNGSATGIETNNNIHGSISGNRVRGLVKLGSGVVNGIYNINSGRIQLRDNDLSGDGAASGIGLRCNDSQGRAIGNIVNGFATPIWNCRDDGNSL